MMRYLKILLWTWLLGIFCLTAIAQAETQGIYITQGTLENTGKVQYLIKESRKVGINTFVIDFDQMTSSYRKNIALVKSSGLRYIARIVMFPGGAMPWQVTSEDYLGKRLNRIQQAVSLGADEIQLDYIRYRPTQAPSEQNSQDIAAIVKRVKTALAEENSNIPLQIDIFGIATHREAVEIGQDAKLLADIVNVICPMVYPSHYEPFRYHAVRPYETVYDSLIALQRQIENNPDVKIIAYLELFNYRYPLTHEARVAYINAQLNAARDAKAEGYYIWSANNHYDILFSVLAQREERVD